MAKTSLPWNPSARRIFLFWRKVDKSGGPDACWPSQLIPDKKGYCHCRVDGWYTTAHRIAWALENGPIEEDDINILHSCDNRSCCNPKHLFPGTQADNLADMDAKGRRGDSRNFGENHGRCKLTDLQVIEVKRLYAEERWSQQRIADHFGMGQTQIGRIINGESRLHLFEYPR